LIKMAFNVSFKATSMNPPVPNTHLAAERREKNKTKNKK
jgi:hypothetical protein